MSQLSDVTLVTDVYSTTQVRINSTIRAVPKLPIGKKQLLTISHEVAKSGAVSSAFILDDSDVVGTLEPAKVANNRFLLKIQYNPLIGRTNADAVMAEQRSKMIEILSDDAMFAKFLNLEH